MRFRFLPSFLFFVVPFSAAVIYLVTEAALDLYSKRMDETQLRIIRTLTVVFDDTGREALLKRVDKTHRQLPSAIRNVPLEVSAFDPNLQVIAGHPLSFCEGFHNSKHPKLPQLPHETTLFECRSGRLLVSRLSGNPEAYFAFRTYGSLKGFANLSLLVTVFMASIISALVLIIVFRVKEREARKVIQRMADGDLSARFHVSKIDELAKLMTCFNDMAQRIQDLIVNLEQSEAMRTRLVGEISHDLRTPICAIGAALGSLDDLSKELSEEKKAALIRTAQRELGFVQRLIEYLFALARAGEPDLGFHPVNVNLGELLDEEIRSRKALDNKVIWRLERLGTPLITYCDRSLLQRFLKNLLDNGSRYARKKVLVALTQDDDCAELEIRDDGPGLKFNPFEGNYDFKKPIIPMVSVAASASTSLGIGSNIIRAIAELHQWEVSVDGTDRGTRIIIRFPLNRETLNQVA